MSENIHVLFDTGLLRKITDNQSGIKFFAKLRRSAGMHLGLRPPWKDWIPERTPFSFLEWVGLNTSKLAKPKPVLVSAPVEIAVIGGAFSHYERHYERNCPELDTASLILKSEKQMEYLNPETRCIWDGAISGITNECDVGGWVRSALAFDALHKLEVSREIQSDFSRHLLQQGFFNEIRRVRNMSKFRLAKKLWNREFDASNSRRSDQQMQEIRQWSSRIVPIILMET